VAQLSTLGHKCSNKRMTQVSDINMKRLFIIVSVFTIAAIAYASTAIWQSNQKPPVSLTEAVKLATDTLNKDGGDFYCLRADVMSGQTECDWYLDFGSTNGIKRWVEVGSDKSVIVRKDGPFVHE
jgi:hypothetical protein